MFNFKSWFSRTNQQSQQLQPDGKPPAKSESAPESIAGNVSESQADGHNDFALALYDQLSRRAGNVFFSPYSVRVACAMAHAGARGETAEQMSSALRFITQDGGPPVVLVALAQRLSIASQDHDEYELTSANALWSQAGAPLEPEFVELMTRRYNAYINSADFRGGDFETARADLNRWVEEKTRGRIQNLVPAGGISVDTRLALVNAVYFKGSWWEPFNAFATRDETFYPESVASVKVPLMSSKTELPYVQADGFQAVELDYEGGDLSMLVLLPDKKLHELEASLSARMLENCMKNMVTREVMLYLPKFKMTQSVELSSQLSELGMPLAFTGGSADFSGINGYEPPHEESLYISDVFHQAMVEVNEEGTEAAAATDIGLAAFAVSSRPKPVPIFRADHPFVFAIREKQDGTILFLGRVDNPALEG